MCMVLQAAERSLNELKDFAGQLKSLPQIQRHISIAEAVNKARLAALHIALQSWLGQLPLVPFRVLLCHL